MNALNSGCAAYWHTPPRDLHCRQDIAWLKALSTGRLSSPCKPRPALLTHTLTHAPPLQAQQEIELLNAQLFLVQHEAADLRQRMARGTSASSPQGTPQKGFAPMAAPASSAPSPAPPAGAARSTSAAGYMSPTGAPSSSRGGMSSPARSSLSQGGEQEAAWRQALQVRGGRSVRVGGWVAGWVGRWRGQGVAGKHVHVVVGRLVSVPGWRRVCVQADQGWSAWGGHSQEDDRVFAATSTLTSKLAWSGNRHKSSKHCFSCSPTAYRINSGQLLFSPTPWLLHVGFHVNRSNCDACSGCAIEPVQP